MAHFYPNNAFKGRVGAFVGETYNGTAYVRRYRNPANPNTLAQRQVRMAFKQIGEIAKYINCGILQPYTFPKPPKWSAYDEMTKLNVPLLNAPQWNPAALKIFDGPLYNPGIKTAEIVLTVKRAAVYITFNPQGGEPSDIACLVVNDEAYNLTYYKTGYRRNGAIDIAIDPQGYPPDFTQFYVYLCFAQEPADSPPDDRGQDSATAFKQCVLASDSESQRLAL
jgi:hypothetical protein